MASKLNGNVIPFSVPFVTGAEVNYLAEVIASDHTQGDGPFTKRVSSDIRRLTGAADALLTTSCSHALDMAAILLELQPGDEVVLPSFTFPSAANAIALRGATAVFVDCNPHTGNIDIDQALEACTERTRAIIVMHYGGMPVELDALLAFADERRIAIIEDAAHGFGLLTDRGGLGTRGTFGTFSFHATKNIQCGEGGALLVNDAQYQLPAEIIREKGTNRSQFLRGAIDKYTWVDRGSSYLPSEYNAAVLAAQLDQFALIQDRRFAIWDSYRSGLEQWAERNNVELMTPSGGIHAAHMFYVLVPTWEDQQSLIEATRAAGVVSTFHYQPLHSSPAGQRYGRAFGDLQHSVDFSRRLVRLPLWAGMTEVQVQRVVDAVAGWTVTR